MINLKTINQAKFDKKLRTFIDRLSKIKIDFKLNSIEQQTIEESGETSLLYTICMMKVVLKENDVNVRKKLGLRIKFYKYLKTLLEEELFAFAEIALNYMDSLSKIEKISEDDAFNYFMNFFIQGQEYIRENYYPEDSPFRDPEFLDKLIAMEELLEQIQEEGLVTDTLELEFVKSQQKMKEIVLELSNKQKTLKQKMLNSSEIQKEDLTSLLTFLVTVMEEYELLVNLMNCAIINQKEAKELCDEFIFFIADEGLLDKFNQSNKLDIKFAVKECATKKHPKRKKGKTNKHNKNN